MKTSLTDLKKIVTAIRNNSDFDFENYSFQSLHRRMEKVLYDLQLDVDGLLEKIEEQNEFCKKVANLLMVRTTGLFRDTQLWQVLKHKILNRFANKESINIWHVGCSTGQEVYSTVIILTELGLMDKTNILASDINQDFLDKAKSGEYKYNDNYFDSFEEVVRKNPYHNQFYNEVPYSKYFELNNIRKTIKIHENLRKKPVWKKHDLVKWTNIFEDKFDIIMCRNVLIYFNIILQFEVIENLHQNMFNDSILILGKNEDLVGPLTGNFEREELFYIKKF